MPLNISMPTYVSEGQGNENEAFASAAVRPFPQVIRFHGECHKVIYFSLKKFQPNIQRRVFSFMPPSNAGYDGTDFFSRFGAAQKVKVK